MSFFKKWGRARSNGRGGGQPVDTPFFHSSAGHKRPMTRRELIGQGFLAGTGAVFMPGLLSLLWSQKAHGRELVCAAGAAGGPRFVPFIVFDLAGGGNIPGSNVIVGKAGGQEDFLASYSTLGLPDAMSPKNPGQTNNEYGLLFHADSAILRGMNTATAAATRAQVDGAAFLTSSNDDTGNNPHNPAYWIVKAGASGELVKLAGSRSSPSGGNSTSPAESIDPGARPVVINRPQDVLGLINPGKLATLLSGADVERILKAASTMSGSQLAMFQEKDVNQQLKDLVECGYINGGELVAQAANAASLDPAQDPVIQQVFTALGNDADEQRTASIAKLVLEGKAGAGTVTLAGYDYHDGSRATGERKDEKLGRLIGQVLEVAARKQSDVMIYVFTDGGVTSNGQADNSAAGRGKGGWQADSGQRSAAFSLVYNKDPGKRPPLAKEGRRQIGAFKDTGGVDENANKISGSVVNLSRAVVANYLALHGLEGKLTEVTGANPFGADLASEYLAFTKLR
jgi:hypothetical protein